MSLNVLLVIPRIIDKAEDWYAFPLGVPYVSASLKQYQKHNVYTLNLNETAADAEDFLRDLIILNKINIVATGGLSQQYSNIFNVVSTAKHISSEIVTIVGGGYISSDPEAAMLAMPQIDIGVIAEGEITICELVDAIELKRDLNSIQGIVFRYRDYFITTKSRPEIKNLDELPFPDYEGFSYSSYLEKFPTLFSVSDKGSAVLLTSRSCPYKCTFCFHPAGNTYRKRSLDNVFRELDMLVSKHSLTSILILDELLGVDKKRLYDFCERIKKYHLPWWTQMRVDSASQDTLQLMKDSGCRMITLGIESADDNILKSMRKYITSVQIDKALNAAKEVGIGVKAHLIFGDTEETVETAENSIQWWLKNSDVNIQMLMIIVFPGTGLYRSAIKKGIFKDVNDRANFIKEGCPLINVSKMADDEYNDLCVRISTLSRTHGRFLTTTSATNINWDLTSATLFGECPCCNASNSYDNIPITSENNYFMCSNCNAFHKFNFPSLFYSSLYKNLASSCETDVVLLWGQGRVLTDFFTNNTVARKLNFIFVDKSIAKQGKYFFGHLILSPDDVLSSNPSIVIISTGDAKYWTVRNELNDIYRKSNTRPPRIFTLGEFMNPSLFQ